MKLAWLGVMFIWLCVIASLKGFVGSGAAYFGITAIFSSYIIYDLIRNGK